VIAQILAFCARIYAAVVGTNTILGIIQGGVSDTAKETLPNHIENMLLSEYQYTHVGVYSFPSIRDQLVDIVSRLTIMQASIDAIPTGPQLAGSPVTLPTTPPTGYGTGTSIAASDVWGFLLSPGPRAAGDLLVSAGWNGLNQSIAGVPYPVATSRYFVQYGSWAGSANPEGPTHGPIFPIANILGADTLSVFLERESYYTGWSAVGDGTWTVPMGDGDFYYSTNITDDEFLILRDGAAAGADLSDHLPPVWPGVLNVTFGTPVSISTGFTITDSMDGVIVALSGVPPRANFFDFDGSPSYRNLGSLSFFTDDNEQEAAQSLGFESAIYTPRTMFQAAGVKLRTIGGVSGLVTPWHRTPV